jgi:hypothetical protein
MQTTNATVVSDIIKNIRDESKRLYANKRDANFFEVGSAKLALGAKLLPFGINLSHFDKPKWEYKGAFRYFDETFIGAIEQSTKFMDLVTTVEGAWLCVLYSALAFLLRDDEYSESGIVPFRLCVVSTKAPMLARVERILRGDSESMSELERKIKRDLELMVSVDVCVVRKEAIKQIFRLEEGPSAKR